MNCREIQIRDPFILKDDKNKEYYLYGTTDKSAWSGKAVGFDAYVSKDLLYWEGPHPVFRPKPDFWADQNFWAPEVHLYHGRYYMIASFKSNDRHRGVQILAADSPLGPFETFIDGPVTPSNWDCLDGTLYLDESEQPWIIFSHEWTLVEDGQMCCMKLSKDLRSTETEPVTLFTASQASWSIPNTGDVVKRDGENYVTDGPFLYKTHSGALLMLWSSYSCTGYAMGISRSVSGKITGPWVHDSKPIYQKDGGHGMLFQTFEGRLMLAIHSPNVTPNERLFLIPMEEIEDQIKLV